MPSSKIHLVNLTQKIKKKKKTNRKKKEQKCFQKVKRISKME